MDAIYSHTASRQASKPRATLTSLATYLASAALFVAALSHVGAYSAAPIITAEAALMPPGKKRSFRPNPKRFRSQPPAGRSTLSSSSSSSIIMDGDKQDDREELHGVDGAIRGGHGHGLKAVVESVPSLTTSSADAPLQQQQPPTTETLEAASAALSSSTGIAAPSWQSWVSIPDNRTGAQALQTAYFLFIIGGSSEPLYVPVTDGSSAPALRTSDGGSVSGLRYVDGLTSMPVSAEDVARSRKNRLDRLSSSNFTSKAGSTPETEVILFIDLLVLYEFTALTFSGDPVMPITSKASFALEGYDLYISYACDISKNGTTSGTFLRISLPPGELWSLEDDPSPPVPVRNLAPSSQRFGATLGQYAYYMPSNPPDGSNNVIDALPVMISYLYLFGGRDADMQPITSVEQYFNDTWTTLSVEFPKPYCFCSVTQGLFGEQGIDALYLSDCKDCATWASVNDTVIFLPNKKTFVYNSNTNGTINNDVYWPATDGVTSNGMMATMVPGLSYNPRPNQPITKDPLTVLLYDTMTKHQINLTNYRPQGMQDPRTGCAVFTVSGFLMCIGGQTVGTNVATSSGESVQLLPNVYAMPDQADGVYEMGQTPTIINQGSCGTNTMLMLATDPDCQVMIPYTKMFRCEALETKVPINHLVLDVNQELEMYVCATDGTCVVPTADRFPCNSQGSTLNDEYSCLWARCCWDANAATGSQCFKPGLATEANQLTTGWMQTTLVSSTQSYNPRPIVLLRSAPTPDHDNVKIPRWLEITMLCVGGVLVILLGLLLVRYRKQRQLIKKRQAYATNAFFAAFGKAYQVHGLIGQGSYGAVFLAERARDKKLVALKIIPCLDYKQRDAALKEFDLLNHLRHPQLIPVLDLIINWDSKEQDGDTPFDTISRRSRLALESGGSLMNSRLESGFLGLGDGTESNSTANAGSNGNGGFNGLTSGSNKKRGSVLNNTADENSPPRKGSRKGSNIGSPGGGTNLRDSQIHEREGLLTGGAINNSGLGGTHKGSDLVDMIPTSNRLPSRFICIATEFFPEGDLTRFVMCYPKRGAINIGDNDPLASVMHYAPAESDVLANAEGYSGLSTRRAGNNTSASGGGYGGTSNVISNSGTSSAVTIDQQQQPRSQPNSGRFTGSGATAGMYGERDNTAYAALSGGDPSTVRPIPELTILKFCKQIAEVLSYMHNLSPPLVHRDLKPDNVLVDKDRVVVTDFGLSSWQNVAGGGAANGVGADACVGTLFFTAPESLGGPADSVTPAVDCWALGCIVYAMCTRRVMPETARVMFSDVDDDDFEDQIRGDLALGNYSSNVTDLVMDLLRRDPAERMTSLQALKALTDAIEEAELGGGGANAAASSAVDAIGSSIKNFLSQRDR